MRNDRAERAERAARDPRVRRLIAESAARFAAGDEGQPDDPAALDERLARLIGRP